MYFKVKNKKIIDQLLADGSTPDRRMNTRATQYEKLPILLDRQELISLSQISTLRFIFQIAFEWTQIFATIALCSYFFNPITYLFSVIFIGAKMHALAILSHDCVHYRLHQNKRINDLVGNLFCAWPSMITIEGYRKAHFNHHKYVGTEHDADALRVEGQNSYQFPKTKKAFLKHLGAYLMGAYSLRDLYQVTVVTKYAEDPTSKMAAMRLTYLALIFGLIIYSGHFIDYLLFWSAPSLTVLLSSLYFRYVAEHFGVGHGALKFTRNVIPPIWQRLLIAPLNVGYHLDHHLYPSVPFYNLKKLHTELTKNHYYLNNSENLSNYWDVIKKVTRPKDAVEVKTSYAA